ncbi:PDDEXK nuclease domain-containing protein, partial [Candidatus Bathycorpusculum sp.]|uniref:PDDEXK nuclease domain-containing protein n=1 Tax=Candidatus Bathycorpusculum sp. TaxID=2994959 RepID=UPI0028211FA9|nr:PDDEXK nuclease domain-containing protein [Candidatus Termitimicrobium sp.]
YSVRNLNYMRKFAEFVNDKGKVPTVSALLSWSHNRTLLDKTKTLDEYLWYAQQTIENGWSLSSLQYHVDAKTYLRQGLAEKTSNYTQSLHSPFSGLASDTLKNPYVFDFIEQREAIIEREIENELVANIAKTIMELGTGFAFVGNQYHLEVSDKDYYLDLLFYNTKLRCYVVIELKNTEFKPEYAGKLNFYLSAVDDMLKHKTDNPSIGIILCKTRDKLTAEYALKDIHKPIGVSEYKLSDFVPAELVDTLPSVEDIEKRVKLALDFEEENKKDSDNE